MSNDGTRGRTGRVTRRSVLGGSAVGAGALLAGCSGGGDGDGDGTPTPTDASEGTATGTATGGETQTPTETDLAHVSGGTLDWFTMQDPANMTWLGTGVFPWPRGGYANHNMAWDMTMQSGIRGPWINPSIKSGDVFYETYESVDITPEELTLKIRDDAQWSNGDHVTAEDPLGVMAAYRLFPEQWPLDNVQRAETLTYAVTDWEVVDDKTLKLISDPGLFTSFLPQYLYTCLALDGYAWGGIWNNTKIEPYDEWFDAIEDWWDMARNGEINPWGEDPDFDIFVASAEVLFGDHGWSETPEENDYDNYWETYFRDPDNVVTSGAWTLGSIDGSQSITLVPNEHHYAADQVNFDEVVLHYRESQRPNQAALSANSQDYYRGTVPQHIAEGFPSQIEMRTTPSNGGLCYGPNHRYPLFADASARKAIMYATDRQRLAQAVHQTKYDPVTTPGAHAYRASDILGEDWVEQNLQSYQRDIERASELMTDAGFSREGGQWVDGEGTPLSIVIPTPKQTPTLAPTLASQLKSFGIDASIQTYSGANFTEKKNNGDFNILPANMGVGFPINGVTDFWNESVRNEEQANNWWRFFPEDQVDEALPRGFDEVASLQPLTIEAPPVGEPDGELQEWTTAAMSYRVKFAKDQETYQSLLRQLAWIYNWYMPMLPIANGRSQQFFDTAHWLWPAADAPEWEGVGVGAFQPEDLVAYGGFVSADPENTESGASVQE